MKFSSLRLRLVIVWAVFIAITLQIAGVGLRVLFERSIARRTQAELEADLRQIRRGMDVDAAGQISIAREPTDPQFYIPLGGRYWQVSEDGKPILRSRSLDREALTVSEWVSPTAGDGAAWLIGPKRERLFAVVRRHALNMGQGLPVRNLVITTAVDAAEITEDTDKFSADLWRSLLVLAGILLVGAAVHVTIGLRPLKSLSAKVGQVRAGKSRRLDGEYPEEVMPLVSETNALLEGQEKALQEARARAGDLAHGLKTPLAIMGAAARSLRRAGNNDIAADIDRQVEVMRRHVDRELARVRARGSSRMGLAPVDLVALCSELVRAIECLPRSRLLNWQLDVPDELLKPMDADDFNNMAGNVIENAGKWAASQVRVVLQSEAEGVRLAVEDDGPGIPEDQMERVLRRGERANTSVAGSGLGLAIVNDIVVLYGGKLTLAKSGLGGLRAEVFLPG